MSIIKNIRNVFKDYKQRIEASDPYGTRSGRSDSRGGLIQRYNPEDTLILASREIARSLLPDPTEDFTSIEEKVHRHLEEKE